MAASGYGSQDDVLRDALRVFREIQTRGDQLISDVQVGVDQANRGQSRPLDVTALIDGCTRKLAEEGIRD